MDLLHPSLRVYTTLNISRAKWQNTESSFYRVSTHPSLLILSAESILLSLFLFPAVPFPSPRPNAAHNSRSQFSISADFSIRLRGAAILTRGTRQLLRSSFLLLFLPPPFLCTNIRMLHRRDDIANWKVLGFLSLCHLEFLSHPANQTASMRRRDWKKQCLEGNSFASKCFKNRVCLFYKIFTVLQ